MGDTMGYGVVLRTKPPSQFPLSWWDWIADGMGMVYMMNMRTGRPTDYTPEIGDLICMRIADDEGLSAICRDDDMPQRVTVYGWLRRHQDFANNYTRARLDQGHTVADEMREVRRKVEAGTLDPAAARVITDALKWEAGKRAPKSYGDKLALVGGDDTDSPIKMIQRRVLDVDRTEV